jgi:Family of unknown function (DUF5654)
MQEYPQGPAMSQAPVQQPGAPAGRRMPGALDPRSYDPRRVVDQQQMRDQMARLAKAQAVAKAKAQATSTIFLATVVSLATSAFGVVAALAWNQAIHDLLTDLLSNKALLGRLGLSAHAMELVYAIVITVIAVVVILTLNRVASRIAKQSAIDAAEADAGSL